jgi:glutamate N-acetyltransferase / amino-acid N-acetyltransferase
LKFPAGYTYAAIYAGIRKQEKNDLALIVSTPPARAAAVFTRNMVQAAPVRLARKHLASSKGRVKAVLVNAGNANCATRTGDRVALATARAMARALGCRVDNVLPSSTGVIGVELDPSLVTGSVTSLAAKLSPESFEDVANAILTTDTRQKIEWEEVPCEGGVVQVVGMAKGSGMIQPNMATMLAFVMTDAVVRREDLKRILARGVERSFHSLTVDGDTSTNDTLLLLANGASNVKPRGEERDLLSEAVARVMERLARQIAADGEGARKLIVVRVAGFRTRKEAARIARAVANSPLVKTAIAGSDANWGRILAAAGYSGAVFDPADIDIDLQQVPVCRKGLAADYDEPALKAKLDAAEVHIDIVHRRGGKGEARFFTCDLTEGYIQINGSYRT